MRGEDTSGSTRAADLQLQESDQGLRLGHGTEVRANSARPSSGSVTVGAKARRGQWREDSGAQGGARKRKGAADRGGCNDVSVARGNTCSASHGRRRGVPRKPGPRHLPGAVSGSRRSRGGGVDSSRRVGRTRVSSHRGGAGASARARARLARAGERAWRHRGARAQPRSLGGGSCL